ncbi:PREDICTED: protein FANTASTIC FOUR 1-like [Nelumbo nucifera]|uniref:Protein FANTASTIC FOUR 1-like n=1 Tax=Nelumbo nucifera TaxID=4432 RepID=A0A1U7YX32_NELNU|nr:PREDICTED: protein FANTASTIC FOUR 1-like [Nelumbo nucifera]
MDFCKKTVHSFLSLSSSNDEPWRREPPTLRRSISLPTGSLCLLAGDMGKPLNPTPTTTVAHDNKQSEEIGFLHNDAVNGGLDRLTSCTESLGFESLDERVNDYDMHIQEPSRFVARSPAPRWRNTAEKFRSKSMKYPPPLTSLSMNGQPTFYLKPVRKDGRLELTEVKINRPEILVASRQDGRLRLQFIKPEPIDQEEEMVEEQNEEEEEEKGEAEDEEVKDDEDEEEIKEEEEEGTKDGEKSCIGQWQFPVGSGEGFRRCNKEINYHRHRHRHHHHQVEQHLPLGATIA